MAQALLIDITRCIGCRACVAACKEAHGLPPGDADTELSAGALTALVDLSEELHVRRLCLHCRQPSCASACPVGALARRPDGPVTYDAARCLGCRYCLLACPFGVPRYEWHAAAPAVRKCDLCVARTARGRPPACVAVCPTEATVWGERDALLREARRRAAEDPGRYVPRVYGEHEVGGTSVLFVSGVPFERLGLRTDLGPRPLPELTWRVLEEVPGMLVIGGAFLTAVWWITHRREEVARAAGPPPRRDEPVSQIDDGEDREETRS